jgi:hypothetical protein
MALVFLADSPAILSNYGNPKRERARRGPEVSGASDIQRNPSPARSFPKRSWLYAATIVKLAFAIAAILGILILVFFRTRSESGLDQLERSRSAVRQAKSWTVETSSQEYTDNFISYTTTIKVNCPNDYAIATKSQTYDGIIKEHLAMTAHGTYYEANDGGKWQKTAFPQASQPQIECGKGPTLANGTVFSNIEELQHRGKVVRGERQTVEGVPCQEWNVDFGNEWPQMAPYSVCIDLKTDLPRRVTFPMPRTTFTLTGWNLTTVVPPVL